MPGAKKRPNPKRRKRPKPLKPNPKRGSLSRGTPRRKKLKNRKRPPRYPRLKRRKRKPSKHRRIICFHQAAELLRGLFHLPPLVNLDASPVTVPEGKKRLKIGQNRA